MCDEKSGTALAVPVVPGVPPLHCSNWLIFDVRCIIYRLNFFETINYQRAIIYQI